MVVVVLTDSPPKLRGDLSKWLLEVNTGVYVGNVSSRVREELWERICENLRTGRATMVYTTQGEQKMDFCVHNSLWEPVDFDGIKLMKHPSSGSKIIQDDSLTGKGFSKAAKRAYANKVSASKKKNFDIDEYMVIDVETTGLSCVHDHIIEIAALHIVNGEVKEEFNKLVQCETLLPQNIVDLTGITDEMLLDTGEKIGVVLEEFISFCQAKQIVGYNVVFDLNFIRATCQHQQIKMPKDLKTIDVMKIAKRKIKEIADYKISTVAKYLNIDVTANHRALHDSYLSYELFEKLNEIS